MDPMSDYGTEHNTCYDGLIKPYDFLDLNKADFPWRRFGFNRVGEEPNSIFLYNIEKSETNQLKVD